MIRRHLLLMCLCLFLASAPHAASQSVAKPDPRPASRHATGLSVDASVVKNLGADFNGVVLVRTPQHAEPLIRTYGQANFETRRALSADSLFQIGSISKWITAVAILRLVDQGKVSLDAPIGQHTPDLPAHIRALTLRQLLSNSAGVNNGFSQAYKLDKTVLDLNLTHAEAALRFASGPLLFAPGSGWDYAPTTWMVVAAVMEGATGKPYSQAIGELVLQPAKVVLTGVPSTAFKDMGNAALPYRNTLPRQLNISPDVKFVAASGTIYSTASDLARLAHTVFETGFLSESSRQELMRVQVAKESYALGGRVRSLPVGAYTRTVAWAAGQIAGSKSLLVHVPGQQTTIVILNNTDMPQSSLATAAQALLHETSL